MRPPAYGRLLPMLKDRTRPKSDGRQNLLTVCFQSINGRPKKRMQIRLGLGNTPLEVERLAHPFAPESVLSGL